MENVNRPCLVINASFEPMHICSARRAMTLLAKGAAIVQERSKHFITTSTVRFPLPSVIRLLSYRHVPRYTRAVSRKSIFLRDGNRCQYCLDKFVAAKLTLDHVVPKCKGGKNTWENLVTCCYRCNNRKGDQTPEQAGMTLAAKPRAFGAHAKHRQAASESDGSWDKYLFY